MPQRVARLRKNAFVASFLVRAGTFPLSAAASLAVAAIVLSDTGPSTFGVVALVTSLTMLIPFADLGVSASLINAYASKDPDRHSMAAAAWRLLWLIVLTLSLATLAVHATVGWGRLLGTAFALSGITDAYVTGMALLFFASVPFGIGQRILVGSGQVPLATLLQALTPIVSLVITTIVAATGAPDGVFILAPSAGQLVTAAMTLAVALRRHGLLTRVSDSDALTRRRLVGKLTASAGPMLIVMVGLPIALQSDRLVLSHFAAPHDLAAYSVAAVLYAPALALIGTVGLNLWPMFARVRSEGLVSSRSAYLRALGYFGVMGLAAGLALITLGPTVTRLWTGSDDIAGHDLWIAFGLLLFVQGLHLPAGMLLTTPSQLWFQAVCVVGMLLTNLPLSIWFAHLVGASGPPVASVISIAACQAVPGVVFALRRNGAAPHS